MVKTNSLSKKIKKCDIMDNKLRREFITFLSQRESDKKMNSLIENKKKSEALKFLPKLNSELMKIAKTGIIKKQNASRNVSRFTKKITTL